MTEQETSEKNYGIIDAKTPIGRVLEFDIDTKKLEDEGLSERMTLVDFDNSPPTECGSRVKLQHPDGELFMYSDETLPTVDGWNTHFAGFCTGHTDPQEPAEPTEEPEAAPAEEPVGIDYKKYGETGHTLAERAQRLKLWWDEAKSVAASKKTAYDDALEELLVFMADAPQMPLFQQPAGVGDAREPEPVEDWRGVRIEELDVPEKVIGVLLKANLPTIGDLVDLQSEHGTFWVKHLNGIGPKAGGQIDEAMMTFWEAHPEAFDAKEVAFDLIVNGKKAESLREIQECTDVKLLADAQAKGLKGDWRRSAVAKRLEELKTLNETEG